MVWRSVIVSKPAKLKREHFALVIEQDKPAHVPFEDIAVIVLNNREITLTHPVLSACAEYGIGLYATGDCFGRIHGHNSIGGVNHCHLRLLQGYRFVEPSIKQRLVEIRHERGG